MQSFESFANGVLIGFLIQQNALQKQLLECQQEIIQLQKKLQAIAPAKPDTDVHWNKVSGGLTASDVIEANDLEKLQALNEWIFTFGEKYIKPYVHVEAYAEVIAHMSRDIPRRMAELEIRAEFGELSDIEKLSEKHTNKKNAKQTKKNNETVLPLFPLEKLEDTDQDT